MRQIGTIESDADAEDFSDYLLTLGIGNMVEENAGGGAWAVWIEKDDDLDRAKAELEGFLKDPRNAKYRSASKHAERLRTQEEKKEQRLRKRFVDVRTRWGQPQQWAAPLTLTLIGISVAISLGTNSIGLGKRRSPFIDTLLFTSSRPENVERWEVEHPEVANRFEELIGYWWDHMKRGQVWRLITPIFIHWDFFHLLFNMFWLRDLGAMIETRRGTLRLFGLVLVSAVISNFAEYFWAGPISAGGMSGVVYALFGYVWVKGKFQPHFGLGVSQQTITIMIAWLFLCMTGLMGSIANAAHVAGLVVGLAAAYLPYQFARFARMRR